MNQNYKRNGLGSFAMFPPVIKNLIIINVAVFVLQYFLLPGVSFDGRSADEAFKLYFALWPVGEFGGESFFYLWQPLTYQFLHGSMSHLFFNLFALWMLGSDVEREFGARKFMIFYILSGIGAALFHLIVTPMIGNVGPTVGASGSIFGILLAYAMLFPNRSLMIFPLFIPIRAKYFILILIGIDLLGGFGADDGIAHFAHLGGAAAGFLLFKFGDQIGLYRFIDNIFGKAKNRPNPHQQNDNSMFGSRTDDQSNVYKVNWQKREEAPPPSDSTNNFSVDGEEVTQAKVDEILDKISADGYQSLTEKEKQILFELSRKMK